MLRNLPDNAEIQVRSLGGNIPWRSKWQPTPVFLLGNPIDRGAWWAIVHGVAKEFGNDLMTKQQEQTGQ